MNARDTAYRFLRLTVTTQQSIAKELVPEVDLGSKDWLKSFLNRSNIDEINAELDKRGLSPRKEYK